MEDPTIPEEYKTKSAEWYKEQYLKFLSEKIAEAERKARYYREKKALAKKEGKNIPSKSRGRPRKYRTAEI